jgi:NAD(P)-dependent dehydrogenase (short-subunit alcohol dehydrogenase family)
VEELKFEGRVVIVTGAGNGLGRAHALEFGRRGAAVVVNDLGCGVDGIGVSHDDADRVVAELRGLGAKAVASYGSVATKDGAEEITEIAIKEFGRVDVVVNNAGVLQNGFFSDLTEEQLATVINTHYLGAIFVSQPAFRIMCDQGYGRFVFTTSAAGLFGLRNQTNYASAKAALIGLSNAIAIDGAPYGILSNSVSPAANTRIVAGMNPQDMTPEDLAIALRGDLKVDFPGGPEFVTPIVVYLSSEACHLTHEIFSAVSGRFARVFVASTRGWYGPHDRPATAEEVRDHLEDIRDRGQYQVPVSVWDEAGGIRDLYISDAETFN